MRRPVLPLFLAINIGLLCWVLSLWVTPQGRLVELNWQAPAPIKPDITSGSPLPQTQVDLGRFVATLERPLFVPTRRPPPPPPAASAPQAEPLPPMRLMAVFGNADSGGLLAAIGGRIKRVKLGESISGWTVKSIQRTGVELSRGDETTTVALGRSTGAEPALEGSAAGPSAPTALQTRELEERRRAAVRRNELRARAGLPILPLP